jgi:hypothetical protein
MGVPIFGERSPSSSFPIRLGRILDPNILLPLNPASAADDAGGTTRSSRRSAGRRSHFPLPERHLQVRLRQGQGLARGERPPLLCALQVPPQQDAHRYQGLSLSLLSTPLLSLSPYFQSTCHLKIASPSFTPFRFLIMLPLRLLWNSRSCSSTTACLMCMPQDSHSPRPPHHPVTTMHNLVSFITLQFTD